MRSRTSLIILGASISALMLAFASAAQASVQPSSLACAQPDGRVSASAVDSGVLYIGGRFTHVSDRQGDSQARAGLAAIDVASCDVLPWRADTNGYVNTLDVAGGTVYAGGDFTTVAGLTRTRIAALDAATGTVLSFQHSVDKSVRAITHYGTTLYVGGAFTKVDGSSRSGLAGFDINSGSLSTTWKPNAAGIVRALVPSARNGRIYVGGEFSSLDGQANYAYMGAVDPIDGTVNAGFNPHAGFPILSLVIDSQGVYAGGGGSGGHLVLWNDDGSLQRPVYQTDGDVQAVAVSGDSVYGGGHFANYCLGNTGAGAPFICDKPLTRRKLLEVSLTSGDVTSWAPKLNSNLGVFNESIDPLSGDLFVGGDFTTINSIPHAHLDAFPGK